MDTVDQNLPIDGQGKFCAYHLSTDNGKWNKGVQFSSLPNLIEDDLIIVAIGAYSGWGQIS